jgi:hypothetical protein
MRLMIQNAISRYMEIMGPKLHNFVVQIVTRQTVDKSEDQVLRLAQSTLACVVHVWVWVCSPSPPPSPSPSRIVFWVPLLFPRTYPPSLSRPCAPSQVRPMIGTRLGTSAPSDMFALLSENLNIVKQKSSPSLQVGRWPRHVCWQQ